MRLTYLFIGFWYNISYGCILNVFNNYNIKDIKSHLSIIHSGLITVSSILYLNNIIEIQYVLDNLYFLSSYMLCDIFYNYFYWNKKEIFLKSLHHSIAFIGIYLIESNMYETIIIKLFLTEIINIPLELRFLCIRYNYNKYYFKNIMSCVIYILFLYTRIVNPLKDYINICKTGSWIAFIDFTLIYILWIYWFIMVNIKFYNEFSKILFNEIKDCRKYLF